MEVGMDSILQRAHKHSPQENLGGIWAFSHEREALSSQEKHLNSTDEVVFFPFSYHPSFPPPFAPNVDESRAFWGDRE